MAEHGFEKQDIPPVVHVATFDGSAMKEILDRIYDAGRDRGYEDGCDSYRQLLAQERKSKTSPVVEKLLRKLKNERHKWNRHGEEAIASAFAELDKWIRDEINNNG